MLDRIAFIGFGEAGTAFASRRPPGVGAAAYDIKTDHPSTRAAKLRDYQAARVEGRDDASSALAGAGLALSLVTADQALAAASACAALLTPGTLWIDMNSVAPDTKRAAAQAIGAAGGRYVDAALLAPVEPAGLSVPVLVSGPHAAAAAAALASLGFAQVQVLAGEIGAAAAVKMVRSVMVKGLEALTAECLLAAEAAGVREPVAASLSAGGDVAGWAQQADYNLERMIVHGGRRAAEMEEVAATLVALGIDPVMSRGSARWQRRIGALGIAPVAGLPAKLAAMLDHGRERAA